MILLLTSCYLLYKKIARAISKSLSEYCGRTRSYIVDALRDNIEDAPGQNEVEAQGGGLRVVENRKGE